MEDTQTVKILCVSDDGTSLESWNVKEIGILYFWMLNKLNNLN